MFEKQRPNTSKRREGWAISKKMRNFAKRKWCGKSATYRSIYMRNDNIKIRVFLPMAMAIVAMAMAVCGCGGTEDERPVLTVSIEPQRALLEDIVGDRFEVRTLLSSGANPETFEPTIRTRMDVDKSKAYFTIGGMPFETNLASTLPRTVHLVDCAKGIKLIYNTHDHGEGHKHIADPHTWSSVRNARIIACNMYEAVVSIDAEGKEYYRNRYEALEKRLDSLDRAWTEKLKSAPTRAFAIWHPSLSYFARDYGLRQISVGFENKEMPPSAMAHTAAEAREAGVRVLFFQREYDSRQAQSMNQMLGARLVIINPLDYDWEGQLYTVVKALCR